MIKRVVLENFKKIESEIFDFTNFDLIVGVNNSGKSTVLQALAIWQFAVNAFKGHVRKGTSGVQIVLPNFTALPVPEFTLLWRNKTSRSTQEDSSGEKKPQYILIKIEVVWDSPEGIEKSLSVQLRYQSPQTVYAIPESGWKNFRELADDKNFPRIAYVPPFSGLEPTEKRLDDGPVRQQIGKGQPGSILRNLLLRVIARDIELEKSGKPKTYWKNLNSHIEKWLGVKLNEPVYHPGEDVNIVVEYTSNKIRYDIIAGGSGFHQVLTLLAFIWGYDPTTILLDEPDAHLHVRLQRDLVEAFRQIARVHNVQFITATHAEEFMQGVDPGQIVSILSGVPKRISVVPAVVEAMATISNDEMVRVKASPFIFYLEGETDERVIRSWAKTLGFEDLLAFFLLKPMLGGNKELMQDEARKHFSALRQMVPDVSQHILLDLDGDESAIHPPVDNLNLSEWKRKNIENYLIVPAAWCRAAAIHIGHSEGDLLFEPTRKIINDFFVGENLTLPPNSEWSSNNSNIFEVVNGKRILFENNNSLFQKLRAPETNIILPREEIAAAMTREEIHDDVKGLFEKLCHLVPDYIAK